MAQLDGYEKSRQYERLWLPVEYLVPNPDNPNKMTNKQFDFLVDNIDAKGVTEEIEVRQLTDDTYRIMSGHHRFEACKYLGWAEVPVVINSDPDMTDESEQAQLVRMNAIKGKLDPEKFLKLYNDMSEKHSDALIMDMFGFADEKEFEKLIKQTEKSLPPDMQEKFKEAKGEIKTIDQLAKVLNELMWVQGDTLEYGYMIFDFDGKEAIWLRMRPKHQKLMERLGNFCRQENRALDDVMAGLIELVADQEDETIIEYLRENVAECDKTLPNHIAPTRDNIEAF